MKESYKKRKLS